MSDEDTGISESIYDEKDSVLVEISASKDGVHVTFRHYESGTRIAGICLPREPAYRVARRITIATMKHEKLAGITDPSPEDEEI
ncbi:hypothetical protein ACWD2L_05995 [Streptomyces sp. NPDC002754]